jgi:hypothetical protein
VDLILHGHATSREEAADVGVAIGKLGETEKRALTYYAMGYDAREVAVMAGLSGNPQRFIERQIRRVVALLNGGDGAGDEG